MSNDELQKSSDSDVWTAVSAMYARQCRLIDSGYAEAWAGTFTHDGVFESPTYGEPVRGTDDLVKFAEQFARAQSVKQTQTRHILTNIDIEPQQAGRLLVYAYLAIVITKIGGDSRLVRMTAVEDRLVRTPDHQWRIAHRIVRRDDGLTGKPFEGERKA